MKKIIFFFALIISIAVLSGNNQSGQNVRSDANPKAATPKDLKGIIKTDLYQSKAEMESINSEKSPEGKPSILFILTNDTGHTAWSPSLWWSYQYAKPVQPGC